VTLAEVRAEAATLGWTEAQASFLADRIRNAMVPVSAALQEDATGPWNALARQGLRNLEDALRAVEDAVKGRIL
jgi:hypothetical protein